MAVGPSLKVRPSEIVRHTGLHLHAYLNFFQAFAGQRQNLVVACYAAVKVRLEHRPFWKENHADEDPDQQPQP